jgi:hypothetical protein
VVGGVAVGQVGTGEGQRTAPTPLVGGAVVGGGVVAGGGVVGGPVVGGGVRQVGIGIGVPVGRGDTAVARAGAPRTARASRPVTSAVISALIAAMPAGRALRNAGRRRI